MSPEELLEAAAVKAVTKQDKAKATFPSPVLPPVLSPEELEELELEAARTAAAAAAEKAEWLKGQAVIKNRDYRARKRAEDEVAYKRKVTDQKLDGSNRNRDRVNEIAAGVRERNLAAQNFYCELCELPLQSQAALDLHLTRDSHKQVVAGTREAHPEQSADAARLKSGRDRVRAEGRYTCFYCKKKGEWVKFDNLTAFTRHKDGARHKAKVAAAVAAGLLVEA